MKKTKYITILLASLFFCINSYAQNAESAQGLNEITQNGQAPKAQAANTSTTKTATYTSEKGTITITSKTTKDGVSHSIAVKVPEGEKVSMEELVKSVANAMNRDGNSAETKATLLAISQAVSALAAKGELPAAISGDFSMEMATSPASDSSSNTTVSITAEGKTVSAALTTTQDANGTYSVAGTAGSTTMNVSVAPTENSYVVSGVVAGSEVKSTVSNQTDASTSLDSATVTTESDGKVVASTTTVNNADGTHTVTETDANGTSSSTTYEGTADAPVTPDTSSSSSSSSSSNIDNLGGVGDETVSKDPSNNDTMTETEVEIPDSTIVTPEEFTTPESITE